MFSLEGISSQDSKYLSVSSSNREWGQDPECTDGRRKRFSKLNLVESLRSSVGIGGPIRRLQKVVKGISDPTDLTIPGSPTGRRST